MNASTSRGLVAALLCVSILGPTLVAQEMPPAPELAKFDRLLGTWEGSGTASMGPAGEQAPWTSTITYSKVLGGHFILDVTTVNIGPDMPEMEFRSYYGWDAERGQYVAHGAANGGNFGSQPAEWVGDALVTAHAGWDEGQLSIGREIMRVTQDALEFTWDGGAGTGPLSTLVKGSYKRVAPRTTGDAGTDSAGDAGEMGGTRDTGEHAAGLLEKGHAFMAQPAAEMKQLDPLLGAWKVTGSIVPAPGAPEMAISGIETFVPVLGGHCLLARVIGDPMEDGSTYEAHAYFHWNERTKRFDAFHVSSMGESSNSEAWLISPEQLVSTSTMTMAGMPMVMRFILDMPVDGKMSGIGDAFMGAGPAMRTFTGNYERVK